MRSEDAMQMNKPSAFIAPHGAVLGENSPMKEAAVNNLSELCAVLKQNNGPVPPVLIFRDLELLRTAIKYADMVPWVPVALAGVPGGDYDTLWEHTVHPIDVVSYQAFHEELVSRDLRPKERRAADAYDARKEATILKRTGPTKAQFGPSATGEEELSLGDDQ